MSDKIEQEAELHCKFNFGCTGIIEHLTTDLYGHYYLRCRECTHVSATFETENVLLDAYGRKKEPIDPADNTAELKPCEHKNTFTYYIDALLVDVEMCSDCGMSRSIDVQMGDSEWIENCLGNMTYIVQLMAQVAESKTTPCGSRQRLSSLLN